MRTYKIKPKGYTYVRAVIEGRAINPHMHSFSEKLKFLLNKKALELKGDCNFDDINKVEIIADGKPTIEWVKE